MRAYIVHNITAIDIHVEIPAPRGSGRSATALIIPGSSAIDILPFAGSIENCKNIAFLRDLEVRNMVRIRVI